MKLSKAIAAALLASTLTISLAACDRDGPLEDAGEELDDSFDDAGDGVNGANDVN